MTHEHLMMMTCNICVQLQDLGDTATEGPQQKADHNKKLPSHGLAHLVVFFLQGEASCSRGEASCSLKQRQIGKPHALVHNDKLKSLMLSYAPTLPTAV